MRESAHNTYSLFTIHCSLFTVHANRFQSSAKQILFSPSIFAYACLRLIFSSVFSDSARRRQAERRWAAWEPVFPPSARGTCRAAAFSVFRFARSRPTALRAFFCPVWTVFPSGRAFFCLFSPGRTAGPPLFADGSGSYFNIRSGPFFRPFPAPHGPGRNFSGPGIGSAPAAWPFRGGPWARRPASWSGGPDPYNT